MRSLIPEGATVNAVRVDPKEHRDTAAESTSHLAPRARSHSTHRRPRRSRADLPQGAKVVRPVRRSTWPPGPGPPHGGGMTAEGMARSKAEEGGRSMIHLLTIARVQAGSGWTELDSTTTAPECVSAALGAVIGAGGG
jgi:hypothetical protein